MLQKRYEIKLTGLNNEWQHIEVKYRTARFDDALKKTEPAFVLQVKVNGEVSATNLIFNELSEHALDNWEDPAGRMAVLANWGPFALRNFKVQRADYSAITVPKQSGESSNESDLVDFVAIVVHLMWI